MPPGIDGLVGHVIGGYRLVRLLGSSATAAVFLGQHEADAAAGGDLPERAAIKVLIPPPQLTAQGQADFRARFRGAGESLRQLQHPHIVPVRALGEDEATGFPYLVLPYLEGGTLATRLSEGPLPLATASQYFAQLSEALDYAHGHGVVHGNVKPANILFDQQGQVYLADAGMAGLLGNLRSALGLSGQLASAPEYMAPEQARGEMIGPAADIYSAGTVLYQMVTGRLPFQATSPADMLLQIVQGAPIPPRQFRPELPQPAEVAIMRALAKAPGWRLSSAGRLSYAFALGTQNQWSDDLRQPAAPPAPLASAGQVPVAQAPGGYPPHIQQWASPPNTPSSFESGPWTGAPPAAPVAQQPGSSWGRIALIVCLALVVLSLCSVSALLRFRQQSSSGVAGVGSSAATHTAGSSAPGGVVVTNQEFKIATDLPVSGVDASVGLPTQFGVDLAVQQNKDLGNGNTLTVIHKNYEGTTGPDSSIGAADIQQLLSDPTVMAVVGPFNSGVAKEEIPIVNNGGLVLISPTNTNPGLTKRAYATQNGINFDLLHPGSKPSYYFRLPGPDDVQGKTDAQVAHAAPISATTAYVVDDDTTYGHNLVQTFTPSFTSQGGTIVGSTTITPDQSSDLPQLAAAIAGKHPAVVFYGGVTSGGGAQLKQALTASGYNGPMVGGDGIADDPAWLMMAGSAAVDTYATVAAPDISGLTSAKARKFISDYQAAFPGRDLLPYSAMAYDAAMIEITAIKNLLANGKQVTRAAVRDEIAGISYDGVTGTIVFDANGDNMNVVYSVYHVDTTGQWVFMRLVNAKP